jgi:hypothetical protein
MLTMASVHQASEISEGDRVTRGDGSMQGTVKRILDPSGGFSNGGIPMASVDWDSGSNSKVTVRDLKKVTAKTALYADARSVGAVLKRGGFDRSSSSGSRIRGAPNITPGYVVKAAEENVYRNGPGTGIINVRKLTGVSTVDFEFPITNHGVEMYAPMKPEMLNKYEACLRAAGYTVSRKGNKLLVEA